MVNGRLWLHAHRGIVMALCSLLSVARAAGQQAPIPTRGDQIIARGTLGANDKPRQQRVSLEPGPVGWEIVLQSDRPTAADLDLYVYDSQAPGSRARSLCSSEGVDAVEVCRLIPVPTTPVIVEIVPNGGDGETGFVLTRRPLRGPRMGETQAVAGDARPLPRGIWLSVDPRDQESGQIRSLPSLSQAVLFQIRPGTPEERRSAVVVSATDPAASLAVRAFGEDGREITAGLERSSYQDLPLNDAQGAFVLISPGSARTAPGFGIGVFPTDKGIPIRGTSEDWSASGRDSRAYQLRLKGGQTAIIKLEATRGALSITDSSDRTTPVMSLFGSAQQVAWIGDPVGASRHLLTAVRNERSLLVGVRLSDSTLYQRVTAWTLNIHTSRTQPSYLIRLAVEDADTWEKWWTSQVAIRNDTLGRSGIRIIALQPPPELERPVPNQASALGRRMTQASSVFLARLESPRGFHLAVCTSDGQVLDVGGPSPIRWEWSQALGQLYLVVFPDPQDHEQAGGPFRLELTRSLIEKGK